jgi:hypothetical protein
MMFHFYLQCVIKREYNPLTSLDNTKDKPEHVTSLDSTQINSVDLTQVTCNICLPAKLN